MQLKLVRPTSYVPSSGAAQARRAGSSGRGVGTGCEALRQPVNHLALQEGGADGRLARRCAAPSWGAAPRAPSRGLLPTPAGAPSAAWHAAAARAPPRHGLLGQGRVARGDWGTRGQHRVTNLGPQRPTGRTGRASEGLLVLVAVPATREMRRLAAHRTPGCRRPGWQSLRPAASCERSRARPAVPPGAALHTEEHIGGHLRGTAGTATRSNSTRGIWMAP